MEQFMEMLQGAEASVKAIANPEEALKNIYSQLGSDGEFRVYARHPFCYQFNY